MTSRSVARVAPVVRVRRLSGFDDPALGPEDWNRLLRRGGSNVVHLTWQWQRAWWDALGRGELMLIAAEREGEIVAVAPFYEHQGIVFFVGSGESCYLDFVGEIDGPGVLEALLEAARDAKPALVGFRFYGVPASSPTCALLASVAERMVLDCYRRDSGPAWKLDLTDEGARAAAMTRKKSLVRHENFFRRTGALEVVHAQRGEEIEPELGAFFEQHVARRAVTADPSAYVDPLQRRFTTRWVELASRTGWLRFTRISWNGQPIAFHLGSCYEGRYHWHKPSFAIDLARRSPGEVLLRQLLIAAIDEGAHVFDFGSGDDPFKARFTTSMEPMLTWDLYPPSGVESGGSA